MTATSLLRALALAAAAATSSPGAVAGPGAHGPNGEHVDGQAGTASPDGSRPRFEAKSEQFELVATLGGGELSMLIDRFATNEPVLKAQVEIESGGLKARAPFHADIGDYAVADAAMLKLLGKPGEHAVVITVINGDESDLLDAVLKVTADQGAGDDHGHEHASAWRKSWIGLALAAAVLVALAALRHRVGAKTWNGGPA